jgi:hypothetical protein
MSRPDQFARRRSLGPGAAGAENHPQQDQNPKSNQTQSRQEGWIKNRSAIWPAFETGTDRKPIQTPELARERAGIRNTSGFSLLLPYCRC